jgi:AbrB family looped-hinge helix DNA binding protein
MSAEGIARVRGKGQVTLPAAVRAAAHIEEGTVVEVSLAQDGAVILRPKLLVDAADAWYWTKEWQTGEAEVDAEIARDESGRVYLSDEEFLSSLDE